MQLINYTIDAGLPLSLWRGIPAQLTLKGIPETSGDWLFLIDTDWVDGVILSGTVTAEGRDLIVTLADMHTAELAHAIQGKEAIAARATLTDSTSRVYLIPLTIRNRAIEGTPTPVEQYYTKAQIDALIAGITPQSIGALPAPAEAGTPGQVLAQGEGGPGWQTITPAGIGAAALATENTFAAAQTVNGNVTINGILDIFRVGTSYSATIHMGTPNSYSLTITGDGQRVGFGYSATASGNFGSLAVGYQASASGGYGCLSVGQGTLNPTASGAVIGKYNVSTTAALVVGGGTRASDRKNIAVIDWSGNMTLAGDLTFTASGTTTTLAALIARIEALEA